jgi:LuxR family maltose regulon positive regulatory protein
MTEIRAADLRLTREEAGHFLSQMLSPALAAEEVRLLVDRTEGWIAGLQLAALALQRCTDHVTFLQTFSGSQRYLSDYVREEILGRLPTSVRDFLLHIAILTRLDGSVCQAVTAEGTIADCQRMLAYLERHNLFLVPLDEERSWYRLHDLFREALLAALHAAQPETAPVLHRRAATFYEAHSEWSEAIAHRLASGDFVAAGRLMEQTVEQFWLRGEAATMASWVLALPSRMVREHARLALTTSLYLLFTVAQAAGEQRTRAYTMVRQLMARIETALLSRADNAGPQTSAPPAEARPAGPPDLSDDEQADAAERALLQQRLRLLRMFLVFLEATASGDLQRLNTLRQEVQEALDRDEEAIWQMVPLSCSFVLHFTVWQEGARLLPRLLDAKERVSQSGSRFATIKVGQWLALTAPEAGRLRLAYEESQAALGLIRQMAGYALLKGYFEIVQAEVLYQWNRLEEARGRLRTVMHDAAVWQQLDLLGWGYTALVQVELASGAWSAAQQAWNEVELLAQRERVGNYLDWLPTIRAQWSLAQGHLEEAVAWAEGVTFPEDAWEGRLFGAFPVVVRVYFALRRWREALELLERWSERLDRPTNIAMTIRFLAQYVVALHQTGQREQARAVAARLFALTEPEGYIRVYLDEGEPMRQTLQALLTPRPLHNPRAAFATTYVTTLLAAFERECHGASTSPGAAPRLAPSPTLTRRERDVLHLLATGASNQEIAHTLTISLATVKKHVSNLLGKLGATSRTQAIVQARTRSLL